MASAFHATTAPPTSANAAQAARHCSAARSAAGPERATPMLVPELIRAFALSCSSSRRDAATASPMGGEASPLLLPATSTPSASTQPRSEEHTSELQSRQYLVCRLLLE